MSIGHRGSGCFPLVWSRKSLLFLCLSVASVVAFLPSLALGATVQVTSAEITASSTNPDIFYLSFNDDEIYLDYPSYSTWNSQDLSTVANYYELGPLSFPSYQRICSNTGGGSIAINNNGERTTLTYNVTSDFKDDVAGGANYGNCASSGTYYLVFASYNPGADTYDCSSKDCFYIPIEFDSDRQELSLPLSYSSSTLDFGFSAGFNSTQNTRFTDLDLTGTSTVNIDVEYFLDQSEVNTTISERNPTLVRFQYSLRPTTELSGQSEAIDATASGTASVDTNLSGLSDGTYDLLISFSNLGVAFGSAPPFPDSYIYTDFTIFGGVLVATGTVEYYDATTPLDESQPRECGLTDIGGCIVNAFSFLFIPSTASLNNFSTLNDTISTKFPFAYAYDFSDSIETLYITGTTESLEITVPFGSFGDITLLSADLVGAVPFASLIKTTLGYLLWLMFAVQMYRRTLTIFNTNPA